MIDFPVMVNVITSLLNLDSRQPNHGEWGNKLVYLHSLIFSLFLFFFFTFLFSILSLFLSFSPFFLISLYLEIQESIVITLFNIRQIKIYKCCLWTFWRQATIENIIKVFVKKSHLCCLIIYIFRHDCVIKM